MSDLSIEDIGFKPVKKAPSLFSFYGVGTRLYGKKDLTEYSGLYTTILYFTILYIPIFALGKYVAQMHGENEYILGKGKLHSFAKSWNGLLSIAIAVLIGFNAYQNHINSPQYIAQQSYERSLELIEEKDFKTAIDELKLLYRNSPDFGQKAKASLTQLADEKYLATLKPEQVFQVIKGLSSLNGMGKPPLDSYKQYFDAYQTSAPKIASDFAELIATASNDEVEITKYNELNYQLLKSIYAKHSDDLAIAERYALLDERLNQCSECINILESHKEKLQHSEGARILGQAYALNNNIDDAYKLLSPYVALKLGIYHRAEKNYESALNNAWDETIALLNSGGAAKSFYDAYDKASEDEQRKMVDDFYIAQRDKSSAVARAMQAFEESTSVVPVALDLGIVLLNRARTLTDPSERQASLNQAEKTFLSVQNYAGDSDQYQLYLAQVYYWLGQESKGDELFNALLTKYDHSHQILMSLSRTLRDLGSFSKSNEYAMLAYQKATAKEDKQAYAQSLALLADDLPEKIEWLEKADKSNPYVKGDLLSSKGHLAASKYQRNKALNYYQQSIDVYQSIPEDATQLNNIALIYLSKYRIGFNAKDFEKALANLDKAVGLSPEDSILLGNASFQHLAKAYTDILSPLIDFKSLQESPSLSHFYHVYKNQNEKTKFAEQLSSHPSFKKGLSYLEKSMLLAPKNSSLLNELYSIYSFTSNDKAIEILASRFESVELDLAQQAQSIADYRSGVDDAKSINDIDKYLEDINTRANQSANKKNALNTVIIESNRLSTMMSAHQLGKQIDLNNLVKAARANYQRRASSSTRSDLEASLVKYLISEGKSASKSIDNLFKQYERILDDRSLLAFALIKDDSFRNAVKAKAESRELEQLLVLGFENFKRSPAVIDWYLLKQLGSASADKVKQAIISSPIQASKDKLVFKQTVSKEQKAIHKILMMELNDQVDAARDFAKAEIEKGVKIPNVGR